VKYIEQGKGFDWEAFKHDIPNVVRAMDNVVDRAIYPLSEQELEAKTKRRMGLGVTGLANAAEIMGLSYGSETMLMFTQDVMTVLRNTAYRSSISLAIEKGAFPLFHKDYLDSEFAQSLPRDIREDISKYGIRNSHLLSVAPTGTISLKAGNVSSGLEPPFLLEYSRGIYRSDGSIVRYPVADYALAHYGIRGKTSEEITAMEHVNVLNTVSKFVDSSVSKTCNVGPNVTYEEFKDLYMAAYEGGASGCTTFRSGNIDDAPLQALDTSSELEGAACFIDPETGQKSCE